MTDALFDLSRSAIDPSLVNENWIAVYFGQKGGFAVIENGHLYLVDMPLNPANINKLIAKVRPKKVIGENVHAMPSQGVVSVATFMWDAGRIEGMCIAWQTELEKIEPRAWTAWYQIGRRGDFETTTQWKDHLVAHATTLFPKIPGITKKTADALLILNYYLNPERTRKLRKPTFR